MRPTQPQAIYTIAYMAQSLDGFIAGVDNDLSWLEQIDNPTQDDFGFAQFMASVDALLMGRHTFETVASFGFWPYNKPVYVASQSLHALPEGFEDKAFLISGNSVTEMLETLLGQGHQRIYIDGGQLIQSALAESQLDEMVITTVPVLLGQGISLFSNQGSQIPWQLAHSEVLLDQLVKSTYRRPTDSK
ncbi:hypothetical protein VST7929_01600 [Vibrio stylophorae]|uniref:Bacterial bifunctional deaminase-reductase C-terminal domain-containing protein n=2 Tax=Vibrio stylophorae TaxID=659351 RepID=A0ABN8DV94_9VIBR|nr:hypothetical protein VST7929_01600 [Vibrio stylophorae]